MRILGADDKRVDIVIDEKSAERVESHWIQSACRRSKKS